MTPHVTPLRGASNVYAEARLAAPESIRGMQAPREPHVTLSTGGTRRGAGGVGTGGRVRGGRAAARGRAREPRATARARADAAGICPPL